LLGRLRMSVDEAIEAYKEIASAAFRSHSSYIPWRPDFDAAALEMKLNDIVTRRGLGDRMLDADNPWHRWAETVVFARVKTDLGVQPKTFRSYCIEGECHQDKEDTIIETVRDTTAQWPFFPPQRWLDMVFEPETRLDWAPHVALTEEARRLSLVKYGRELEVTCSVSLGAGPPGRERDRADRKLNEMCRSCDKAWGNTMLKDPSDPARTFEPSEVDWKPEHIRLSIIRGFGRISLDDWTKVDEVRDLAARYARDSGLTVQRAARLIIS